jgi:hypothetical protein
MNLIVESKRDPRVRNWLASQVDEDPIVNACKRLAGGRRTYISNIAKALNLWLPTDPSLISQQDPQRQLELVLKLLRMPTGSDDGAA